VILPSSPSLTCPCHSSRSVWNLGPVRALGWTELGPGVQSGFGPSMIGAVAPASGRREPHTRTERARTTQMAWTDERWGEQGQKRHSRSCYLDEKNKGVLESRLWHFRGTPFIRALEQSPQLWWHSGETHLPWEPNSNFFTVKDPVYHFCMYCTQFFFLEYAEDLHIIALGRKIKIQW